MNTISHTAWLNFKIRNFHIYMGICVYLFCAYVNYTVNECHCMMRIMGLFTRVVKFKYGVCAVNFLVKFSIY